MLHTSRDWKSLCAAQAYLFVVIFPVSLLVEGSAPSLLFVVGAHFILGAIGLGWLGEKEHERHAEILYSRYGSPRVNPFREVATVKMGIVVLSLGILSFYAFQLLWLLAVCYLLSSFLFYATSVRLAIMENDERARLETQNSTT